MHVLSRDCERAAGPTAGLFMLAQVQGLVSAAQHNGRSATVLSYDPARGRYRLTLDGADAGALSHTASSTHRPDRLAAALRAVQLLSACVNEGACITRPASRATDPSCPDAVANDGAIGAGRDLAVRPQNLAPAVPAAARGGGASAPIATGAGLLAPQELGQDFAGLARSMRHAARQPAAEVSLAQTRVIGVWHAARLVSSCACQWWQHTAHWRWAAC